MKKLNKIIFPVLIAILGLLSSATSYADNEKLYPGSMCIPLGFEQPTPFINFGEINNPSSTKWLSVDCPIIRDNPGGHIKRGYVNMFDQNYNYNISCRLASVHRSGAGFTGWWYQNKSSAGSIEKVQKSIFGKQHSISGYHYFYSCTIPPKYNGNMSGISSYSAREI